MQLVNGFGDMYCMHDFKNEKYNHEAHDSSTYICTSILIKVLRDN